MKKEEFKESVTLTRKSYDNMMEFRSQHYEKMDKLEQKIIELKDFQALEQHPIIDKVKKGYNKKIDKIYSRNLLQRVFNKRV